MGSTLASIKVPNPERTVTHSRSTAVVGSVRMKTHAKKCAHGRLKAQILLRSAQARAIIERLHPLFDNAVDSLAFAAWQNDRFPTDCLPAYRRKAELELLASRHVSHGTRRACRKTLGPA